MYLPFSIRKHLPEADYSLDHIGCSSAQVMMFSDRVLKIEKDCNISANEYHMMRWLQGKLPVPEVIAAEKVGDTRYLLMSRIGGTYLCDDAILDDQERLAELVADGLRKMWAVDISDCPTIRTLDEKFKEIDEGLRGGWITKEQADQPETYGPGGFESPAQLFEWLVKNRPKEEFVLSHGDYCMPNVLLEAMCMGMPCVSTDCPSGGPRELIENGVNGLLVPVGDVEALHRAMERMADPVFAKKMADAAYGIREELTSRDVFVSWYRYLFGEEPKAKD